MSNRRVGLTALLNGFSYIASQPKEALAALSVCDIVYDSRKAAPETIFVCMVGESTDGHRYAQSAYEKGCRIFVVERQLPLAPDALQLRVENSRHVLALLSHAFFGHPAKQLTLIGVTGTKGKTTIANLTANLLSNLGIPSGVIGTNGVTFAGVTEPTVNTTPESYELARIFAELLEKGAKCVVMEVSSLGVKQHRTDGLQFDVGVFTNLSPDHIGPKEHASMEEYIACKAELFAHSDYAVINLDDPVSAQMIAAAEKGNHPVCTFSLHQQSDLKAGNLAPWQSSNRLGIGFDLKFDGQTRRFAISQPGEFSVYNGLAVIAVCRRIFAMRGEILSYEPLQKALAQATVAGRIELIDLLPDATVIIDYAHNELSMESLLTTLQQYDYKRLVVVFGSVGGRSQLRRFPLGRVAAKYADFCILTADNPDFEPPKEIIAEIAQAFEGTGTPYIGIEDRAEAVRYAITHHQPGDMIVFAGKGHETYQLIRGVKEPFSEKAILLQMVQQS